MKSSQQLERETERSRAQLEGTLEELRARLTPGQVVDQFVDYARDGKAGIFFSNLGRQAVNNPLPVAIMGASLVWLMMSNGAPPRRTTQGARQASTTQSIRHARASVGAAMTSAGDGVTRAADTLSDKAQEAAETLSDTARAAGETISDYGHKLGDSARGAAARLGESATSTYAETAERVRDTAEEWRQTASEYSHDAAEAARGWVAFCREQPLVLAGLGLALGAAVGAAFPATEAEDRLMGNTSDALKEKVGTAASDIVDAGANGASADRRSNEERNEEDVREMAERKARYGDPSDSRSERAETS